MASGGIPETATPEDYHGGTKLRSAPIGPTAEQTVMWGRMREDFMEP